MYSGCSFPRLFDVDRPHTSGGPDLRPLAHRSAHYLRCFCADAKRIVKTALERGRQHAGFGSEPARSDSDRCINTTLMPPAEAGRGVLDGAFSVLDALAHVEEGLGLTDWPKRPG